MFVLDLRALLICGIEKNYGLLLNTIAQLNNALDISASALAHNTIHIKGLRLVLKKSTNGKDFASYFDNWMDV